MTVISMISHGSRLCQRAPTLARSYSRKTGPVNSNQNGSRAVVITGATAEMAPGIILRSVAKGDTVFGCVRDKAKFEQKYGSMKGMGVVLHEAKTEDAPNHLFWNELFGRVQKSGFDNIAVVNTIGAAVPSKGMTLADVNEKPAIACANGLQKTLDQNPGLTGKFVNISSIVPSILGNTHEYAVVRGRVDESLVKNYGFAATALRAGLVYNEMNGNRIDMGHAWSPEQMATLPFQVIVGSGNQQMQPIFSGDLQDAVINSFDVEESSIVNAVGHEIVTQRELFQFFRELVSPKFRPISVSHKLVKVLADHAPDGRIAPYSAAIFKALDEGVKGTFCHGDFEKLVGKTLTTMADVYKREVNQDLVLSRPPIAAYGLKLVKKLVCRHFLGDLNKAVVELVKDRFK